MNFNLQKKMMIGGKGRLVMKSKGICCEYRVQKLL